MAKEHETSGEAWGTLEELLLACAVNRHGTKSWDSIVMEVQNRTTAFPSLTSQHCVDKFNDLKRRFMPLNDTAASLVPIIDELRKIRVEELRREVQRRDVSILSLELKVKKLEEERDRSLREEADPVGHKKLSPQTIAGKDAAGEDSGDERDDRSFNESNSTDQQKAEATTTLARQQNDAVDGEPDIEPDPEIKTEEDPAGSGSNPEAGRDWSHNGKLEEGGDDDNDKVERDKKETEIKLNQTTGGLGESNEPGESVGESKREEKEKEKQNSDVQSSASLSLNTKRRGRRGGGRGGGSGVAVGSSSGDSGGGSGLGVGISSGDDPEGGDEVFPATKRVSAVKSEPLIKLLGTIRSHQLGSLFERRLRSQESQRYKNLIRQHIDIQTIQSRLDKGVYSSCLQKFFRDHLLLFNNAIVFFRKNSPEFLAASELRAVIWKEMTEKLRKPKPESVIVEPEIKQQSIFFSKPIKSSSTMVVCGKSNSAKAVSETATKKGGDKKDKEVEEKPKVNVKKIEGSFAKIEEKSVRKKRTKERSASSHRNSNASNKVAETKHQYGGNELSSHDALEMKVERKGSNTSKRQGAASFLKRMKQNSPSQATENEDDSSEEVSKENKEKEEKGKKGKNQEGITERVTRSSRGRGAREESGRGKRIGRPPKKENAVESGGGTGKRGRDNGGSDIGVGGGRARKRSRR